MSESQKEIVAYSSICRQILLLTLELIKFSEYLQFCGKILKIDKKRSKIVNLNSKTLEEKYSEHDHRLDTAIMENCLSFCFLYSAFYLHGFFLCLF